MYTATVSPKGQITLPARLRKLLGIDPNDKVALVFRENEIILKPLKGNIKDLRGSVKPKRRPEDFATIRRKVKKEIANKATEK